MLQVNESVKEKLLTWMPVDNFSSFVFYVLFWISCITKHRLAILRAVDIVYR